VTPDLAHPIFLMARILVGGVFIIAGVHHFYLLDPLTQMIGNRKVPAPRAVLVTGSLFQIVAGLCLICGIFFMWAALALIFFTLLASVMLLNFWSLDGEHRRNAITQWQSNLAIIGGLLALAVGR
jgi:putative oxidoreductase